MTKCEYPDCEKESQLLTGSELHLCSEHYKLWQFLCRILFEMRVDLDPWHSRFKDTPHEKYEKNRRDNT